MIANLQKETLADFSFGRVTTQNNATVPKTALLASKNVIINNGAPQIVPGYTQVQQLVDLTLIQRMYSFERQTDQKQFMVAAGKNALGDGKYAITLAPIDGKAFAPITLSKTEQSGDFDFLQTVHSLFMNNGLAAYKVVNVAGVETMVPWGLKSPASASSIAIGAGTLNLTFGTRYVYCEVFQWTDSVGTTRYHIGPPSDFSAHTGPLGRSVIDGGMTAASAILTSATAAFTAGDVGKNVIVAGAGAAGANLVTTIAGFTDASHVTLTVAATTAVVNAVVNIDPKAVTVGNMVKANPQSTHFWIFRTPDSQIGTSGTYYFVAQVPTSVSTFSDTVIDLNLDTTRQAPFDNQPPPLGGIMLEYSGRPVIMEGDTIHFGSLTETDLGVNFESFPAFLQFTVPGGIKKLTAGAVFNQVLFASTEDFWFALTGNSEATFSEKDRVVYPGAVGRKCVMNIHGKLVWLSRDKKLWSWTGVVGDDAVPASVSIHQNSDDQLSMNDLSTAFLSQCELQWYSNGTYDFAVLVAPSKNSATGEKDWIQIWDMSPITGVKTIQGPLPQPALTDMFPANNFFCSAWAKDSGIPFVYFGDNANGAIYRWPDGLDFAGSEIDSGIGTPWYQISEERAYPTTLKLYTDTPDPKSLFGAAFVASNGFDDSLAPVDVILEDVFDGSVQDKTVCRASLHEVEGASFGNWVRAFVSFPRDGASHTLQALEISYKPVKGQ